MTLVKDDLVQSLYDNVGFSRGQAVKAVESVFGIMKETLTSGEDILISGFGKFNVRNKAQRRGRNPATGEDLTLEARRVVTFKCSSLLVKRINGRAYDLFSVQVP
jgi:integration host factor subunit alpha